MSNTNRLSRRAVLRGIGVTMGLPFLESLQPRGVLAAPAAAKAPVRMAVLYMPNGVNPHAWSPTGIGSQFELSEILAPLSGLKQDILVLGELMNKHSAVGDGHYVKVAPFLTGTLVTKTTGNDLRCGGVSVDQLVAQRIGNLTPLPSLELSVEPVTMGVDPNVGFTRIYGSHISWSSPTTPVTREVNPQLAFDRLFRPNAAGKAGSPEDKSILDAVSEDAKKLQATVGKMDRLKLDEYFESVRSVEKRIAFDAERRKGENLDDAEARKEVEKLGARITDYYKDPARLMQRRVDHTDQVRLMLDIMVLGFWTDTTRVATFMFGNEVSGKNFSFLPGVHGGHHELSHHENDKNKLEEYKRIGIWHLQQYAYMLERMKAIKEGNGTLLDNSMVLFGSGIKDGNAHSWKNLPIVLAGKGGGGLATGRHLIYEKGTPMCNLHRALMARMGVQVEQFGDSTGVLPGLDDPKFQGLPQG